MDAKELAREFEKVNLATVSSLAFKHTENISIDQGALCEIFPEVKLIYADVCFMQGDRPGAIYGSSLFPQETLKKLDRLVVNHLMLPTNCYYRGKFRALNKDVPDIRHLQVNFEQH